MGNTWGASSCGSNELRTKVAGPSKRASLKVVHRHGPCSPLKQSKEETPTPAEILKQDQARVKSIHNRFSKSLSSDDVTEPDASTNIPAKSGSTVGSGNYVVTVGLGTPKKDLTLIFDTGSDLTWTQCQPCARSCYKQNEPIFDSSQSRTYSNVSCSSAICSELAAATGNTPGCSVSTCVYGIQYGDQSFSVGFFGKERLTLTPRDLFGGFLFGCGQNNQGLFGSSAGLLGLGRNQLSIVQQTATKYGRVFSYCLPSNSSSTGHLTFGKGSIGASKAVQFTPLSKSSDGTSFYGLDIVGISVGGRKLPIQASVFSAGGSIIDSGTVITRLPPAAYSSLRTSFRQAMKNYPMTSALSILDTCYDFSKYSTVSFPKIAFSFGGDVNVDLDASGVFYVQSVSQVCLAFAGNNDTSDVAIFGNIQQRRLEVVYDVAGGRVGFGPAGC
ncbi:Protein ASPARTIC PROTEASE IN GUARD CELL 2 [Morella rubra]|uniref:Protein ASPARTIC PROTEASE IN GUARD CELL 2 n=1 Tax=Morella rubra TaxID=262757 RepID=A0A6A1UY88_9ROSI|nr:Protein ASPARTIC PROTEASE IN GUARD CELL 2 [Morella rubra]